MSPQKEKTFILLLEFWIILSYHWYCKVQFWSFPADEVTSEAVSASHSREILPPTNPSSISFGDLVIRMDPGLALISKSWLKVPPT